MRENSAGIIIFRRIQDKKLYLLLNYAKGHWGFPKGNIEHGESEKEAALRETKEETGIYNIALDPNFHEETKYMFYRDGRKILKTATFMLGETSQEEIALSHEHRDAKWMPFNFAYKTLTFESTKELLNKAEDYLNNQSDESLQFGAGDLSEEEDED